MIALHSSPSQFNAAQYLFVSHRLAARCPELRTSKIILQYCTPWPRQSYLHVSKTVADEYKKKFSGIQTALLQIVVFFLSSFLTFPVHLQDLVVHLCSTALIGYTTLVHLELYSIYPVLVVVPTLVLGTIVHFVMRLVETQDRVEQQRVLGVAPKEDLPLSLSHVVPSPSSHNAPRLPTAAVHRDRRQSLQVGLAMLDTAAAAAAAVAVHPHDVDTAQEESDLSRDTVSSSDMVHCVSASRSSNVTVSDFDLCTEESEQENKQDDGESLLDFELSSCGDSDLHGSLSSFSVLE